MAILCLQNAQDSFFQPSESLDIHSSILSCVSRSTLIKFRIFAWIAMTSVLLLLESINSPSLFTNVKFLSDEGFIITWLYFGLVIQDYWLNGGSTGEGAPVSPKLKYVVEIVFELALCYEVPITIIEWSAMFEEQLKTESSHQILVEIFEHSTPFVLLVIDMTCNSYRFATSRLTFIIGYLLIYLAVNFTYSVTVEPVYDIITWLDGISYLYIVAVLILSIGTQLICRKLYTSYKQPSEPSDFINLGPSHPHPLKQMKSEEDSN